MASLKREGLLKRSFAIFLILFCIVFELSASPSPDSSHYRDKFERVAGEEENDGGRGTKGGKTGKKKKKDDDIVIPFGLEEKAPSKVFLEVEHGEIIATSYTGFTELEPAWEPIVWSPLSDSWGRDSLGASVQRAFVEGNGFTVIDENGVLLSPDGSRTLAPEIGQDMGLGGTGALLVGFAGGLGLQGSAHTILRSVRTLRSGAIATAVGRMLSAVVRWVPRASPGGARLAPRVAQAAPARVISAPLYIILDTFTRPRGPFCDECDLPKKPWPASPPHECPIPKPTGPTDPPDPNPDSDDTEEFPGIDPELPRDGDDLRKLIEDVTRSVEEILEKAPFISLETLVEILSKEFGYTADVIRRLLRQIFGDSLGDGSSFGGSASFMFPFIFPFLLDLPDVTEDERDQIKRHLGADSRSPAFLDRRGRRNAIRHHMVPIY